MASSSDLVDLVVYSPMHSLQTQMNFVSEKVQEEVDHQYQVVAVFCQVVAQVPAAGSSMGCDLACIHSAAD